GRRGRRLLSCYDHGPSRSAVRSDRRGYRHGPAMGARCWRSAEAGPSKISGTLRDHCREWVRIRRSTVPSCARAVENGRTCESPLQGTFEVWTLSHPLGSLVLRHRLVLAILFQGRAVFGESVCHFSRACVANSRRTLLGRDGAIADTRRTAPRFAILSSGSGWK